MKTAANTVKTAAIQNADDKKRLQVNTTHIKLLLNMVGVP